MDFNNDTSFLNNLSLLHLAKIVTDNLCGVRAFIERDELHFEVMNSIFAKIFRREEGPSSCLVNERTVFFRVVYLAPHFPHSHFSYSPVSPLFTCSSVSLFVCSPVITFLCFSVHLCSLFHVFHVPSSLPFHVLCFPFPAFRCLFP